MKKLIVILSALTLFTGCGCNKKLMDTPTKKVEMFFENYQSLDDEVISQLDKIVAEEENFNTEHRASYKELMKKHYKELKYDVKDEKIDGDTATVTVEIEVTDYTKVMEDADKYLEEHPDEFRNEEGEYDKSLFITYRLKQLSDVKDKVKYTLELTLSKVDDEWKLDTISDVDERKIHGMYVY